ncbi:hypothetical protein BC567DRAFT_170760, partial [Phyllosticta citribraziliensis]
TALSHTENLYFVAGRSEIFVYQPNFPDQRLDSDPTLILQPSGPEHAQPIVHEAPLGPGRYINQLIVDFLGNEEILLLALHNGGVIGYRISQIQQAIEKRQEPDCVETNVGDDVTPFFREHVEKSAWGLAVHREARMIAVSSNTHKVTVFAFALDRRDAPSSGPWYRDRSSQRKVQLPNTGTNIPCVAFCNTADDPEGRWLMTTDIEGVARIFDLALIGSSEGLPSTSPIMLLSIRDMILLQPLKSGIESDHVAYHDPLFQTCREGEDALWLLDQDRLNLHAQIPELGVVIVGSAKGRVAVLSLTQTSSTRPGGKTYACRIDHILPTLEQERRGQRSVGSLAGIAVGPIQGMLGRAADHPRRWRLLMMYHDNEVLKYEISKRTDGELRAQEVSELII